MFPIRDNIPARKTPLIIYSLIFINVIVFLYELILPAEELESLMYIYGVVPARFTDTQWAERVGFPAGAMISLFTSMFLHGGFFHLIANMWALWLFGDNVEDRMGHLRFIAFYFICGLGAMTLHLILNSSSQVPTVGASGAIAGIMGAYMLYYPLARIVVMVPVFFYPFFFEMPAVVFLLVWILSQLSGGASSLIGRQVSNVAFWAHIGGFLFGLLLSGKFAKHSRSQPRPYRRGAYNRW